MYGKRKQMNEPWTKNNLEYDLKTTDWILEKVRASETYAQHIYSALCNNNFIKNDELHLPKESTWRCSWKHAGSVIADVRGENDCLDWYSAGNITDEIKEDFRKLGWSVWKEKTDE